MSTRITETPVFVPFFNLSFLNSFPLFFAILRLQLSFLYFLLLFLSSLLLRLPLLHFSFSSFITSVLVLSSSSTNSPSFRFLNSSLLPHLLSPSLIFALFLSFHSLLFLLHHHSPPFSLIFPYSFAPHLSSSSHLSILPSSASSPSFSSLHPSSSASCSSFSLCYLIVYSPLTFSSFFPLLSLFFLLHFLQIIFLSYLFFIPFSSIPPSSYFTWVNSCAITLYFRSCSLPEYPGLCAPGSFNRMSYRTPCPHLTSSEEYPCNTKRRVVTPEIQLVGAATAQSVKR